VDASDPDVEGRLAAVREVLGEIDAGALPEQIVFTKADALPDDVREDLARAYPEAVFVSARSGDGVPALLDRLADRLRALAQIVELHIPYERGDVLPALHREGDVLVTVHEDAGMRVRARLPDSVVGRFADLVTAVDGSDAR
jgi:GTP-binding protein HflX